MPQDREALVVTPWTIELVKSRISDSGDLAMGASRDNPPSGSISAALKAEGQSPQQLSYLSAILVAEGFCRFSKRGRAIYLVRTGK
jgi:hypothetical protein